MEERNYIVYKHICPNSKVYIGITKQDPIKRWNNGEGYKGQYFYKAIEKYGWNNIKHEILYTGLTQQEACNTEIDLIAKYQSNNRDYGYNVTEGGEIGSSTDYGYLPDYEKIKNDRVLKLLFDSFIKVAKGEEYEEITEIYSIDEYGNEILIDRSINKKIIKPNKKAINSILNSYSGIKELKNLIEELKNIK